MFSSLMSAGFHDQCPLLTMLYARRMHAKAEKYIDTIFSLNSQWPRKHQSTADLSRYHQGGLRGHFRVKKSRHFQNEASYKIFLVKKTFVCTRIKSCFRFKDLAHTLVLKQRLVNNSYESIERLDMTLRRPYWCSKQILWELGSFLM